jgi:D-alanyl-D-alanine carboxypeptidase
MTQVLADIVFPSIYKINDRYVPVPSRMAKCTPDTKAALLSLAQDVADTGGTLRLSDLFRSYDMQLQAHLDYVNKKKKAFSPPPGGSMHEAGRAFDVDLGALKMPLADFWKMAKKRGVVPIIPTADPKASEAWHFECRGSHALVYSDYASRKAINFKPAQAMAVSGILAIGQPVDGLRGKELAARIQSALIRLGYSVGNIDGDIGPKTRDALKKLRLDTADEQSMLASLTQKLEEKFPQEFFDTSLQNESLWQQINI